jgi:hypothetical protein
MYALLAIDALLRIVAALAVLFLLVPRLARRRPESLDRMEWFWWCLAAGVTTLTLGGQLLALLNIFSAVTLLAAIAAVVLIVRARVSGRSPLDLVRAVYSSVVVSSINILEGRVNVRRRLRRAARRTRRRVRETFSVADARWQALAWGVIVAVAAAPRLVRPFATANLGFSDTYAHLYLFRLLEQGRQVDPAWGPYPRGMHFLLMAIHELTNIDPILLMNFFGPVVGVLMTLAVADAARRIGGSLRAAFLAGVLFATMTGGSTQYFLFGGSIATDNPSEGSHFVSLDHDQIPPTEGEFDVLQTVFQRQTATLPQELAIVFLFPAALFLLRFFRERGAPSDRWMLSGFFFSVAAISATHPGVAVPLVLLSAIAVAASRPPLGLALRGALIGAAGVAAGSTWMLAFIRYRRVLTAEADVFSGSSAATTAMYYFPFLREGETARMVTWVAITPVLVAIAVIAAALIVRALLRPERRTSLLFVALATLVFVVTHLASRAGLPELVEVRRNASWLAMTAAILVAVALFELTRARALTAAVTVLLAFWVARAPVTEANERLIHYSGYNATAMTVLEVGRKFEPFTWTLVTYGQEFPMVLGKGFHLPAADFLAQYDPEAARLNIPTKYVFIVVEKVPHRFQINTWAARFSRSDLEKRLQTWCFLYQLNHRDIRVYDDDEEVRVYMIERSDAEVREIAEGAS